MRGRGLKQKCRTINIISDRVAPHAGAWIETIALSDRRNQVRVAPHAGAWIETYNIENNTFREWVAPHAGAWIET